MAHEYDRSSKWLIQHHGDSILRLAGIDDIENWRAVQSEVVQPRRLPDGLLEVRRTDRDADDLFLLELATYPEKRIGPQMAEDLMLTWLDRTVVPEGIVLVLHPKGRSRIPGELSVSSREGLAAFSFQWTVVKLWELKAADLLLADDVGVIPWVPLARHSRDPARLIQQCRDRIDRLASDAERTNLLAVTQILAGLRYNDDSLFEILGGESVMIESPVIKERDDRIAREATVRTILEVLEGRFGAVPREVVDRIESITGRETLSTVAKSAGNAGTLDAFVDQLANCEPGS